MAEQNPDDTEQPHPDPAGAGRGGNVPPPEHRWQPGQSGNPKGRPTAGASLREWLNVFADAAMTERQLADVARDPDAPWAKRAAAQRALRTIQMPDLADFEPYAKGDVSLQDLRAAGIDTSMLKKAKVKNRKVFSGGPDDAPEELVEREIELKDPAGEEFDRIADRTEGRPTQRVDLKHEPSIRTPADGEAEADQLLDSIRAGFGTDPGAA